MPLILASSFMKQLKRLQQKEQGVVSRTVLEMQMDATAPTLSIHRVDGGEGWWSAYANGDLRIIFSRAGEGGMVLCWTDHHDSAYLWARRHKLEKHPVTGSMQIVEIPEVVEHNEVPGGGQGSARPTVATRPICAKLGVTRNELLGWGVPELWVERVLAATSEDELLDIGEKHLPPDAAEAVLSIAVGERPSGVVGDGTPTLPEHGETTVPSQSVAGDAAWNGQSWWVISDDDDLKSALENLDWDSWCVYLHPAQRKIAYRLYEGPRRVCGSAGTGKTVVALHHAKHLLAEVPDGVAQDRRGTVSLLTGPRPEIRKFATPEEEVAGVAAWLTHLGNDLGVKANEVALFCRSEAQSGRARKAIAASVFKDAFNPPLVAEMFAAKGLEYRAAVVMACDNGVIPSPERLAEADLVAGLEEIYNTERNLLYVACTRARDYLLITCGGVPSEFLLDMKS